MCAQLARFICIARAGEDCARACRVARTHHPPVQRCPRGILLVSRPAAPQCDLIRRRSFHRSRPRHLPLRSPHEVKLRYEAGARALFHHTVQYSILLLAAGEGPQDLCYYR
eukprot:IDg19606t1